MSHNYGVLLPQQWNWDAASVLSLTEETSHIQSLLYIWWSHLGVWSPEQPVMHIERVDACVCMLKMHRTCFLIQHCVSHMYLNISHYFVRAAAAILHNLHTHRCNCPLYNFNTPLFPFLHHIPSVFSLFCHWKTNFPAGKNESCMYWTVFGHESFRWMWFHTHTKKNVLRPSFHALLSPDWSPSLAGQHESVKLSDHNSSKSTKNS